VGNRPLNVTDPSGLLWAYNSLTGDLLWFDGTREQFREVFGANSGWRIIDGQTFVVTRSGVTNDQPLSTGHRYYLDPSGRAIDLGQNYDPLHEFIHQMGRRATATEHLIGVAAIPQLLTVGVIAGGELAAVAMYGTEMITLGLSTTAGEFAGTLTSVGTSVTSAQVEGVISRALANQNTRGLAQQLLEHQQKLLQYIKNPLSMDNKGFLTNAPTQAIRDEIFKARVKVLVHQIKNFHEQIVNKLPKN
jgi:hypothetical protein